MATNQTPQTNEGNGKQSVYLPDLNLTKTYPTTMSDSEIDYDTHVNVRGNTPEDYHLNHEPNNIIQQSWVKIEPFLKSGVQFVKDMDLGRPITLKEMIETSRGDEEAVKYAAQNPTEIGKAAQHALGYDQMFSPEEMHKLFKPWGDIIREAYPDTAKFNDKMMMNDKLPGFVKFAPWFMSEFIPSELLSFGTNPLNIAMGEALGGATTAALKFGPPLVTGMLQRMGVKDSSVLFKDIYNSEKGLAKDFETLGVEPNSPTSDVVKAWRSKALDVHPDRGGDRAAFEATRTAYENIMKARMGWLNKVMDSFRGTTEKQTSSRGISLSSEAGSADLVPNFEPNQLVKVGGDIGRVVKVAGEIATVNVAGKQIEKSVADIQPYKQKFVPEPLPFELSGAKPRYNIGQSAYQPQFQSDIDKALYITAQRTKSAKDEAYRNYLRNQGFSDEEINKLGQLVRNSVKEQAKVTRGGDQDSPSVIAFKPSGFTPSGTRTLDETIGLNKQLKSEVNPPVIDTPAAGAATEVPKPEVPQAPTAGGTATPPSEPPKTDLGKIDPDNPPDESAVNLERLAVSDEAKKKLVEGTKIASDYIENQTGVKLTHDEVVEGAKKAEVLTGAAGKQKTLEFNAQLLRTRQHLAALAEEPELTKEFLDTLQTVANTGTDIARKLNSFAIEAYPEYAQPKIQVISELQKLGIEADKILEAAKGVDFTDQAQIDKFYRQFVKPTLPEILDEIAYTNILSSPLTHIKNAFSNTLQLLGVNPLTKTVSGLIDPVVSSLDKTERDHYLKQVPAFYKGVFASHGQAVSEAGAVFTGKKTILRPDLKHMPTLSMWTKIGTAGLGEYVTRALEAADIYTQTLVYNGELESKLSALGHPASAKEMEQIKKDAMEAAKYYVYRADLDPQNKSGQGHLMSAIDRMTGVVYQARDWDAGGGFKPLRWYIRFVKTPMNILKQGVEYSPVGLANLPGSADKTNTVARSMIGFMLVGAGFSAAMAGNSTWDLPRGSEERKKFYGAGRMPYSFKNKETNRWVSYSQIGHLAFPLAMGASLYYFAKESDTALSDSTIDKWMNHAAGMMKFFSDQSYMQGLGDFVSMTRGEPGGGAKVITNAPAQLIPLAALQRWANNIIDPLYRKNEKGINWDTVKNNMMQSIIFMSQYLPAQKDLYGNDRKKDSPVINAFSPLKSSKADEEGEQVYQAGKESKRIKNENKAMQKKINKEYGVE